MTKILDFISLPLYCLLLYWLSDQPALPVALPTWFEHQDKLLHGSAYFILALLVWRSLIHWIDKPVLLTLLTIGLCSLYGVSDEWHQSFVEGRQSDSADWLADTIGASLAALLMYKRQKIA
jgi:VanZ family protein